MAPELHSVAHGHGAGCHARYRGGRIFSAGRVFLVSLVGETRLIFCRDAACRVSRCGQTLTHAGLRKGTTAQAAEKLIPGQTVLPQGLKPDSKQSSYQIGRASCRERVEISVVAV